MKFIPTAIPDVISITPQLFSDERGFFLETYQLERYSQAGIHAVFIQDNHSGSKFGVLRGLHYQIQKPQGKLVRAIAGEIFDVAVDLRQSSPTFGKWVGTYLTSENKHQVWIPEGFAHGFYVLSDWAEVLYKTTNVYAPEWERTLVWNDPQVNIEWPLIDNKKPILSGKDAQGSRLSDADLFD